MNSFRRKKNEIFFPQRKWKQNFFFVDREKAVQGNLGSRLTSDSRLNVSRLTREDCIMNTYTKNYELLEKRIQRKVQYRCNGTYRR